MTKKTTGKTAPRKKPTTKAAQPSTKAKKAPRKRARAATPKKLPHWLKSSPTEYIVGTEDYAALIDKHNELFETSWLKWRVQPQVFYTIHDQVWKHYHDEK